LTKTRRMTIVCRQSAFPGDSVAPDGAAAAFNHIFSELPYYE
jgi:hypothetical protein